MDKFSTLDSIVRQLILEQQLPDERRYHVYLAYGYSFLNGEYPAGASGGHALKTVLLDVGPDRIAELPPDYVQLVSLGRVVGDKVRNLAYNDKILDPRLLAAVPGTPGYGNQAQPPAQGWPVITYWGGSLLGLTGWDGLGYGWGEWGEEFAIDAQEGTIRLSSALGGPEAGPLVLQYQSNDLCPGKPTPIHPYWQMALKEWMLWNWYDKAKENPSMAARHEAAYNKQRKKAIKRTDLSDLYADAPTLICQNYNSLR